MADRAQPGVIFLHQRVGRAGHLQRRIGGGGAQQGAGERGLPGAERAIQQHGVPGPHDGRDPLAQRLGRLQVWQEEAQGRFGRGHAAI